MAGIGQSGDPSREMERSALADLRFFSPLRFGSPPDRSALCHGPARRCSVAEGDPPVDRPARRSTAGEPVGQSGDRGTGKGRGGRRERAGCEAQASGNAAMESRHYRDFFFTPAGLAGRRVRESEGAWEARSGRRDVKRGGAKGSSHLPSEVMPLAVAEEEEGAENLTHLRV